MDVAESSGLGVASDWFVAEAAAVPTVRRVLRQPSQGNRVDFIVVADGDWWDTVEVLEPRLAGLVRNPTIAFDYLVVSETEAANVGGYTLYDRATR